MNKGGVRGLNAGLAGRRVLIAGGAREGAALAALLRGVGALPQRPGQGDPGRPALALIDASHPFDPDGAARARATARRAGIPLAVLRRPPWRPGPGDRWIRVRAPGAAALALRPEWRRVFLALGRDRLRAFEAQSRRRFFLRAFGPGIGDDPDARPLRLRRFDLLTAPGPFFAPQEAALFARLRIDALVARNAGGPDAWPKMAAARRLGLPVVLLEPPPRAAGALPDAASALAWLRARAREF